MRSFIHIPHKSGLPEYQDRKDMVAAAVSFAEAMKGGPMSSHAEESANAIKALVTEMDFEQHRGRPFTNDALATYYMRVVYLRGMSDAAVAFGFAVTT